jgi:radical SAM-linked protein
MIRNRYRIRFAKQGDLRFIGHRDLLRTMERLFRRAGLQLSMTEGFHPKPRISFPSALAVGIVGAREIMELELAEDLAPGRLLESLQAHSPPGLDFADVELLAQGAKKQSVETVTYEIEIPPERQAALQSAIDELLASSSRPIHRAGRAAPIDLRPLIVNLQLADDKLRATLRTPQQASVRPRELLTTLGMEDLEQQGKQLVRSDVHSNSQRERQTVNIEQKS